MRTTSEQKEKIKNLKNDIKNLQEETKELKDKMLDHIQSVDLEKVKTQTPEEQETDRKAFGEKLQEFKDQVAIKKATVTGMVETLKTTRLNKNGSSFFEWHPHKGMNRRQARLFRKLRAQGLIKQKRND